MPERVLERDGIGRVDLERRVGDRLDRLDRLAQDLRLVDPGDAGIDVKNRRPRLNLSNRLAQNVPHVARLVRLAKFLLSRRIDPLADDEGVVQGEFDGARVGGDDCGKCRTAVRPRPRRHQAAIVRRMNLQVAVTRRGRDAPRNDVPHRGNVPRCRSAAAADVGGAGSNAGGDVLCECLGTDREDRLPVHDLGESRIRLDDDWDVRTRRETLDEGEKLVGTESAIKAAGVGLERVEERGDRIDIGARQELAVLGQRDGRENRQIRVFLRGEKRGLELVRVGEGLEEDEIGVRFRAEADLFGEGVVGGVELEVARRL